ncbi:MAG: hypothetical protein ACFFBD_11375, partial [Candidatus Hodarchaeota archaeon]
MKHEKVDYMSEELQSTLHRIAKTFCVPILILLPPVVAVIVLSTLSIPSTQIESAKPIAALSLALWTLVLISAALFCLNAFFLGRAFKREINELVNKGMPVYGIEGFDAVNKSVNLMVWVSYSILLLILISWITGASLMIDIMFFSGGQGPIYAQNLAEVRELIFFTAIGLMLISIGVTLIIRVPEKPAFKPGGLLNLYRPTFLPMALDNILSDSVYAFLDPATRMAYDEWTSSIEEALKDDYEKDADTQQTRVERAREKLLLLTYL